MRGVADGCGLDRRELGETWGITVHVDATTCLRINVADYCLLDIRQPDRPLDDRVVKLAVLMPPRSRLGLALRGKGILWSIKPGFTKYVPESQLIVAEFPEMEGLIGRQMFRDAARRHVQARQRRLFSPDRHNPLTVNLLDGTDLAR